VLCDALYIKASIFGIVHSAGRVLSRSELVCIVNQDTDC
jgi:hypothetical protein